MAMISAESLDEILKAFVAAEMLPSDKTVKALAKASRKTDQDVRDQYGKWYEIAGNSENPWDLPGIVVG